MTRTRVHPEPIRTDDDSASTSSSGSILEPVWELCPTTAPQPRPAPSTQSRLAFTAEASGTNAQHVPCGCQAGVPLQLHLGQIFPGPSSAHCSNPCPVIIPFPVVPCHHRASNAAHPPLLSTGPQTASQAHGSITPTNPKPTQPQPCASTQKRQRKARGSRSSPLAVVDSSTRPTPTASAPGVKERDEEKADAAARLLQGSELTSREQTSKMKNKGKDVAAQPLSSGLKHTSKAPLRNNHETATTPICAATLKPAARRTRTQSPPARAVMGNKAESEGEESDSEDSSSDDEEDTALDKLPPSDSNSLTAPKPSHITGNMDDQRLMYLKNLVLATERKVELVREQKKNRKAMYKEHKEQLGVKWRIFRERKKFLKPDLKRWIKEELRRQNEAMYKDWKRLKRKLRQEKADLRECLYKYKKDLKEEEKREEQRQRALEKKRREKAKEEKVQQKKLQREEEKKHKERLAQEKEEKKAAMARARMEEKRKEQLQKEEEKKLKKQREVEESMAKKNRRTTDRMSRYDRMCSWIRSHNPL
ncbi:inner centromere protein-like isoform X2 [Sardina pilchardus]|uniref:inner centromere protein-like isoform X2 n=1 Tax=Sardina pilchardus TaxID=27697 RepID=UPI002E13095C